MPFISRMWCVRAFPPGEQLVDLGNQRSEPSASVSAAGRAGPAPQNPSPGRIGGPAADAPLASRGRPPRCPIRSLTWGLPDQCLGELGKVAGEARGPAGKTAARPGVPSVRGRLAVARRTRPFGATLRRGCSATVGVDAVDSKPRGGTTTVRSDEQLPQARTAPPGPAFVAVPAQDSAGGGGSARLPRGEGRVARNWKPGALLAVCKRGKPAGTTVEVRQRHLLGVL